MPNFFAYFMLFAWPVLTIFLFTKMPMSKAFIIGILGGYLLLPEQVLMRVPILPDLDKNSIAALSVLVCYYLFRNKRSFNSSSLNAPTEFLHVPRTLSLVLMGLVVMGPFLTFLGNTDPVRAGPLFISGLRFYDGLSMVQGSIINVLPFFLAQRLLRNPNDHLLLLKLFVGAALLYTVPILWEIRMSPQLHRNFYGVSPGSFVQQMRGGGFRANVFLQSGLWLAIFLVIGGLSAAFLSAHKETRKNRVYYILALVWLLIVLMNSKALGSLIIFSFMLPIVFFIPKRLKIAFYAAISLAVLIYPSLRSLDLVPVDTVLSYAEGISEERAQSFGFRLENEDILLDRAREKPLVGWGGWGRNRVYHPETGEDQSVTDGQWIIIFGARGWIGYIGTFGLLTLPAILLYVYRKRIPVRSETIGLCALLAANLISMIPDGTLTPLTWMISGALWGYCIYPSNRQNSLEDENQTSDEARFRFSRRPYKTAENLRHLAETPSHSLYSKHIKSSD